MSSNCKHRFSLGLIASLMSVLMLVFVYSGGGALRAAAPSGLDQAKSLSKAFRDAAKRVMPTVVKIHSISKGRVIEEQKGRVPRENPFKGTPFEDFFDDDALPFRFPQRIPPREGLGSGVIIDPTGIILTNAHVVEDADEVLVELADGRQFKGTDIKLDAQTDLAVVRIKADGPLPAAALGDSDSLDIGDWVLAIGNPFALDQSVSAGIISAKGRTIAADKRANFLQTDAAINRGNSGGPLVNLDGEVVGINTAIASHTGGYQGVGFAIPINLAKWVTGQLIKTGTVQRAYLGVAIGEISPQMAEKFGVSRGKGVVVSEVMPNTPAAEAGVREGDVILSFAGQAVGTPRQLQEVVERAPIGSKQTLEVWRDGKPLTISVTMQALPQDFTAKGRQPGRGPAGTTFESAELGLAVTEMSEQMAERLGYKGFSGVLISEVKPGGLADLAGLREGMLILKVGKKAVTSVAEFRTALEGESVRAGILLLVRTQAGNRFVLLKRE